MKTETKINDNIINFKQEVKKVDNEAEILLILLSYLEHNKLVNLKQNDQEKYITLLLGYTYEKLKIINEQNYIKRKERCEKNDKYGGAIKWYNSFQ